MGLTGDVEMPRILDHANRTLTPYLITYKYEGVVTEFFLNAASKPHARELFYKDNSSPEHRITRVERLYRS